MQDSGSPNAHCIFCDIMKGAAEVSVCYEDSSSIAFMDVQPVNQGHTLVVPRAHIRDIWELDRRTGHALADATRSVASAVAEVTGAEGMSLIQSNGAAAGQSVFHLHIHVVPRRQGDRMPDVWPADADWSADALQAVADALRTAVHRGAPD
jgi:histidine triad (HIT) family protein